MHNEKARKEFGKKTYQEEIEYIVTNKRRNNFIKNLTIDLEGNTLVLYNYVDKHGKPLYDLIRDNANENRKVFLFLDKLKRLTEKQYEVLWKSRGMPLL